MDAIVSHDNGVQYEKPYIPICAHRRPGSGLSRRHNHVNIPTFGQARNLLRKGAGGGGGVLLQGDALPLVYRATHAGENRGVGGVGGRLLQDCRNAKPWRRRLLVFASGPSHRGAGANEPQGGTQRNKNGRDA
jgi:hypothetical protein